MRRSVLTSGGPVNSKSHWRKNVKTPLTRSADSWTHRPVLRREYLDFLIPLNERHWRMMVKEWGIHYNRGRPHSSLGPGIPEPSQERVQRNLPTSGIRTTAVSFKVRGEGPGVCGRTPA
jgi:hypothetical protein